MMLKKSFFKNHISNLLIAVLISVFGWMIFSCSDMTFYFGDGADIKEELKKVHTTEYTFYMENPAGNPDSEKFVQRFQVGANITPDTIQRLRIKPGYVATGWIFFDPDDDTAQVPSNVHIDEESGTNSVSSVSVTLKPLSFYASGWTRAPDAIYHVRYMFQKVSKQKLSESDTEITSGGKTYYLSYEMKKELTCNGFAGEETEAEAATSDLISGIENYTTTGIEQQIIKADNSTVVKIYYDLKPITVTLNPGSGSGVTITQTFYAGTDCITIQPLETTGFSKEGSIFALWNTKSDGSGEKYSDSEAISFKSVPAEPVTLYAQWIFSSNVFYVNGSTGDDSGDGVSTKPFKTVQKAIDKIKEISAAGESHIDGPYKINVTGTINAAENSSVADFAGLGGVTVTIDGDAEGGGTKAQLIGNGSNVINVPDTAAGLNLTLTNLEIQNGKSTNGGGINICSGNVTVQNSKITGNQATNGAGIYVTNAAVSLKSTSVVSNSGTSSSHGGGIDVRDGGTLTIDSASSVESNSAMYGGGISVYGTDSAPSLELYGKVLNNSASGSGGGIYLAYGMATVNSSAEITGNSCTSTGANMGYGGGIHITDNSNSKLSSLELKGGTISGNSTATQGKGGAISVFKGSLTISGTVSIPYADEKNDVYVASDKTITIASGFDASGNITITPASYTIGTQVLNDNSSGALVSANYTKFEVTPEDKDGTPISWEITSEGKLKQGNILISTVYLDCASGNDTNDGSESTPVKTLKQACELLNTNDATPTIIIKTAYTIQADENDVLDFSSCSKQVTIKRADGFAKPSDAGYQHDLELFIVDSAITVNMANVILDGNNFTLETASVKLLKIVGGGTVNIGSDTTFKNNKDAAISVGMAAGGATSGTLKISGDSVKFENNAAQSYYGILNIEATGNVVINNCLFENNTLGYGYCIYNGGNLTLSSILHLKDTVGSSYHICNNGKFILSGEISDGKNLYLGASSSLEIGTEFNNTGDKINLTLYLLSYTHGATILTAATGVTIDQALCDNFNLLSSDGTACTEYFIKPKESTAVLALNPELYVHGTGGIEISADASDTKGNGTLSKPYASVQKALEKIAAANDDETQYTINVDGTVSASDDGTVANFSDAKFSNAKVSIIGLGSTKAKLQGNSSGTKNSVVLVSASESNLTLTLKNLTITGGSTTENGGGIQMNAGSLTVENCEISSNTTTNSTEDNKGCGGGIYVDGGTDNALPLVECSIKNCSFSANIAMVNGGAICVQGRVDLTIEESTFSTNVTQVKGGGIYVGTDADVTMTDGTISGNIANGNGGGVYVDGTFEMSGEAQIPAGTDGKNDVYLNSGKYITVTGALTGTSPVATITLPSASYTDGTQVLDLSAIEDANRAATCNQFALSDTNFVIQPDSTKGVLKKAGVSAGGIEIEIPDHTGYTATLSPSSPAFGGSVTLTLNKDGTEVTPTSCTMELYTSDDLVNKITSSDTTSITIPVILSATGNKNFKVRIVAQYDGVLILDDYYAITVQ